ncbi:MAG: D-glucuronyl C5-epimerase family protein [Syntrophaceticus sp.]|jgi:hypothetical protein|nr:D-glucuronyl C5-epimerase family protein [Syntrophaceticus sp.]MDD3314820.1 D-glucuronyl C5-epimerase family protein [Syntrophaceticus sp.]MDD4359627.1 D-glucuronyl C5-epimerase family protein [Syntrophaceticus sp.]MDD4783031.1 D-glucuronyl C5-epimerase family protein [Syntrophaceticus sp.]
MSKHKIHRLFILVILAIIAAVLIVVVTIERWPQYTAKPEYELIVEEKLAEYHDKNLNYKVGICEYDHLGDYLNYGSKNPYAAPPPQNVISDNDGIPKVKYENQYYYNPVTVAQYSLTVYGEYLHGEDVLPEFITAADKLISMQDDSGAFRYPFSFEYYLSGEVYQAGWASGMAQGQALSAFARAYFVTNDERYLEAGDKALQFLITPVADGGVMDTLEDLHPSLKKYVIFEEYVAEPASYTLNGFMFSLLGLHDWAQVSSGEIKELSEQNFESGIETLEKILPYYDIGGFSAYDLGHITYKAKPHAIAKYHAIHIYLLHALYTITDNETIHEFEQLWALYVE